MTGLPPISSMNLDTSEERSDIKEEAYTDILTFADDNIFEAFDSDDENQECERKIAQYLDKKAGEWNLSRAVQLFDLAKKATSYKKMERPTMIKLKELFEQIMI